MGFLSNIRPKALVSGDLARLIGSVYGGGGSTSTGISVNTDSAMKAMSVHSCVKIIADSFGMLPCHMMEEVKGVKNKAKDFYLYNLLHYQPCEFLTADKFWGMMAALVKLQGNFIALKAGLEGRPIRELIPFAPGAVEEVIQAPDYSLFYKVRRPTKDGSQKVDTIPGNRIFHVRGLVLNGFMGLNPVAYARESIALALATEKHGAKLFGHGTMIGGVLSMPGVFKDRTQAQKFIDDFNDTYSSVENAHKAALLEQGVTWTKMAMTSVDSQFLEARGFQKKEIVDLFFGLPLSQLTTGDKTATYASAGAFSQDYVNYALMPLAVAAEMEIRRSLLTPDERKRYYAKFSAGGLLRGNMTERFAAYQVGINSEILSPNECRQWEDLNSYEGGDEYRTRTSTTKDTGAATDNSPPADEGGAQP